MHNTPTPTPTPAPPTPAPVFVLTRDPDPYADAGAIITFTLRAGCPPLLGADHDAADRLRRAIARAIEAVRRTPDESPAVVARIAHAIDQIAGALRAHEQITREADRARELSPPAPSPNGPGRPEPRRPRPLDTPPQNPRPVATADLDW